MEEIPDDERINVEPSLPEGVNTLLMTEEECLGTLQKGERPEPYTKNVSGSTAATKNTTEKLSKDQRHSVAAQDTSSKEYKNVS